MAALEAKYQKKGVPESWLNNNEIADHEITKRDKYLNNIKCSRDEEPKENLEFIFDQSPHFKNTVLTKTYHMIDEDEHILEKAITNRPRRRLRLNRLKTNQQRDPKHKANHLD
uniref:Uncharacterized protein n=1 Tax=Brassica campestris TaxID=3711 RepID=A0A3P6AUA6_BRACM|nr:unnamed protein product [Brassica rapa]